MAKIRTWRLRVSLVDLIVVFYDNTLMLLGMIIDFDSTDSTGYQMTSASPIKANYPEQFWVSNNYS